MVILRLSRTRFAKILLIQLVTLTCFLATLLEAKLSKGGALAKLFLRSTNNINTHTGAALDVRVAISKANPLATLVGTATDNQNNPRYQTLTYDAQQKIGSAVANKFVTGSNADDAAEPHTKAVHPSPSISSTKAGRRTGVTGAGNNLAFFYLQKELKLPEQALNNIMLKYSWVLYLKVDTNLR
jgi:hypothetical protein